MNFFLIEEKKRLSTISGIALHCISFHFISFHFISFSLYCLRICFRLLLLDCVLCGGIGL